MTIANLLIAAEKMINENMNSQDPMRALLHDDKNFMKDMKANFNRKNVQDEEICVTIKSRLLCYESSEKLYKCRDCGAVLTDSMEYLNSGSLVELYEPNDKRDWIFAYCELLAKYPTIEAKKNQNLEW